MELLQQSMIVLEFYLLYRVFAIETLVVQGIHFKTRYNFFLGITVTLLRLFEISKHIDKNEASATLSAALALFFVKFQVTGR